MPILTPYSAARKKIRDGDLLLYRARGLIGRAATVAGRSQYGHAAMAGWWGDQLMNVEMTSGGGQAQSLSNLVARWPGAIDFYRANATRRRWSREKALAAMIAITGVPYGRWNLFRASLLHLPVVRLFVRPETDDEANGTYPPFCSQAIARACRAGGVDPVLNCGDRITEPGDLARSSFFEYKCTLLPDAVEETETAQDSESAWESVAIGASYGLVSGIVVGTIALALAGR